MTVVRLGADEARFLGTVLDRLVHWQPAGAVRIQLRPNALGVWAAPPTDCLVFVAVPLRAAAEAPRDVDLTVTGTDLRAALAAARSGPADDAVDLLLPERSTPGVGLGPLPPADGWQLPVPGIAGDVCPIVDAAVQELREGGDQRSPRGQADLAERIGDRVAWAGLPVRVLLTARRLGLLAPDGTRVAAATCGTWKRLTTVRGQVCWQGPGIPGLLTLVR